MIIKIKHIYYKNVNNQESSLILSTNVKKSEYAL